MLITRPSPARERKDERNWMERMKILPAALVCLAACAAFAQQGAVIRTETRVVLVDTIVTSKDGAYVRGLAPKDFRLFEDNRERTILSVSVEKGAATSRPHSVVVFFAPMGPAERALARLAVSGFIDANVGDNRRIAVVSYNGGLQVNQNFTDDAGRLKTAVSVATSTTGTTSSDNAAAFETVRGLGSLARSLGVLEGRKTVVFVNAGVAQSSAQRAELTSVIEACNKSDVAVYPIDVRPLQVNLAQDKFNDESGDTGDTSTLGRRGRGGPTRKPDPDAALSDPGATNQQALYRLATGTGGFVVPNAGELLRGLQKVGEEQAEYYVLSFTPAEAANETKAGACHTLRVKVDRGGTAVRARSDYCESKSQDLLAGTIAGQDLERRAANAAEGSTLGAAMQLAYFYVSPGSSSAAGVARVNLAMEIPAEAVKIQLQRGKQAKTRPELDFLGIATNAEGDVGARFSDAVKLDTETPDAENRRKPLHYEKEFKLAPGQYKFTMAFSSGSESFGRLEAPLTVEPWQPGELGLSAIVLSRQTHPAAELGLDIAALTDSRTPLISNDVQIVPSGSNRFRKSEPGFAYFEIYGRDPAAVHVEMSVVQKGQTGRAALFSGTMPLKGTTAATKLPTGTLDAGSYTLEVSATDAGGRRVTRAADFEIY